MLTTCSLMSFIRLRWAASAWLNALNNGHRLPAVRADERLGLFRAIGVRHLGIGAFICSSAEQPFGLGQSFAIAWRQQPVVAHLDKAFGQDMLQEALHERFGKQRTGSHSFGLAILIAEGDVTILQLEDAFVVQGDAEDIGRQVLECALTLADRATVDQPILTPSFISDLCEQSLLVQADPHFAPEEPGQWFDVDEEVIPGT